MSEFQLVSDFQPQGDQPQAIAQLIAGLQAGYVHQTLLGATGTGKTYVMAQLVAQWQRPTLVIAHNKTLAAQLYSEFKEFLPHNAVEYFVSYYDYYHGKPTSRAQTPTSKRTPASTTKSTGCACPHPIVLSRRTC